MMPDPTEREIAEARSIMAGLSEINAATGYGWTQPLMRATKAIATLLAREREEHHSTYCETCYVMGSGRDRAEQALATERARAEHWERSCARQAAIAREQHGRAERYADLLRRLVEWANSPQTRGALQIASIHGHRSGRAFTESGVALWGEIHAALVPDAPRSADGEGKAQHDRAHPTPVWGCPACLTPDAPPASATEQADEGRVSALAPERREGVATTGVPPIKGTISGLSGYLVVPKTLPDAPTEGRG